MDLTTAWTPGFDRHCYWPEYARIQGYLEIRSVHLAVGLISLRSEFILGALQYDSITPDELCLALLRLVRPKALDEGVRNPGWSRSARRILERAAAIAESNCVNEYHVWKAVLMEPTGIIVQALDSLHLLNSFSKEVAHANLCPVK